MWGLVPLPEPRIGISPNGDGLTGLATLLWYEGNSQPVTLGPLQLRGYSLTATAKAVAYCWRMGDAPTLEAQTRYCNEGPGSSDNPGASHVYERRGDYTVRMEVSWEGTYTFSGFGLTTDRALGALPIVRTRPYHIPEARSVRS